MDTFYQRPQLTLYRTTWMSFSGTWLSTCLMSLGSASHPYAVKKKRSGARTRWSCPLEVSLFPALERVGSDSPEWVLGSVQAPAVNEPRCSLLCHTGVSVAQYTLLLYLPMFLCGIRRKGIESKAGAIKLAPCILPRACDCKSWAPHCVYTLL